MLFFLRNKSWELTQSETRQSECIFVYFFSVLFCSFCSLGRREREDCGSKMKNGLRLLMGYNVFFFLLNLSYAFSSLRVCVFVGVLVICSSSPRNHFFLLLSSFSLLAHTRTHLGLLLALPLRPKTLSCVACRPGALTSVAAITKVVIPIFIGWSIALMGGASTSGSWMRWVAPLFCSWPLVLRVS